MFKRILIANRGEIACRIIRSAHDMGIETVAVYSDVDADALHVKAATCSEYIGASAAAESYLNIEKIITAATHSGAEAIHPGYGFLSENPSFVEAVNQAGLIFIGPTAAAIRAMGLKDAAKQSMADAGVPIVPGYHGAEQSPEALHREANQVGYPLLIKARAGGGGKGMRLVDSDADFLEKLDSAVREAQAAFGDPIVLLEKFIQSPRHIEVQVLGDQHGNLVHLFERDCSLQRRHQKVIEEAPAPGMTDAVRSAMTDAALKAAKTIEYSSAGTIEFIADGSGPLRADGFWFMEMNTRLQVEHPVTEAITGVDIVAEQIKIAAGEPLSLSQEEVVMKGHSVEARVYAEDVEADFLPVSGVLRHVDFDSNARVDSGMVTGDTVSPFYDPMLAKVIGFDNTREQAINRLITSLKNTHLAGTKTNLGFLIDLLSHKGFQKGEIDTAFIENVKPTWKKTLEVSAIDRLLGALILNRSNARSGSLNWRLWGELKYFLIRYRILKCVIALGNHPAARNTSNGQ